MQWVLGINVVRFEKKHFHFKRIRYLAAYLIMQGRAGLTVSIMEVEITL